ncbi:Uncharacterized protein Adt_10565 [Abeliophyllum distichum]|uniref:Uncharacterized protein n=1 Tax=Abeliophyllum distichum TaxID=126358 RepID=A0ABD1UKC5_9LAMI
MGESTGDRPVVARLVEEVMVALGAKPSFAAIWVLFFGVGDEFDGVMPGMGTTRVTEGGTPMVKSRVRWFWGRVYHKKPSSGFLFSGVYYFLVFWCFLRESIS